MAGIGQCTGWDGALGMVYPIWGKEASLAALTVAQLCLQSTLESTQGLTLLCAATLPSEEQFFPINIIQYTLNPHLLTRCVIPTIDT